MNKQEGTNHSNKHLPIVDTLMATCLRLFSLMFFPPLSLSFFKFSYSSFSLF